MSIPRVFMALLLLAGLISCCAAPAAADYPHYLILQTPPSGPRHVSQGFNPGLPERVSTPAYSYGYFGVAPRKHVSRHFGYYRNYTECSYR